VSLHKNLPHLLCFFKFGIAGDVSAVLNIPTKVKALAKTKGKETG
jgi:hypothetical protein